ncbi:MAG: hypothetical protein QXT63_02155 [Thermoplasmata archaeon]
MEPKRFDFHYSYSNEVRDCEEIVYVTKPKYHLFSVIGFENAVIVSIFILSHILLLTAFIHEDFNIKNLTKTENFNLLVSIEFLFLSSLVLYLLITIYNYFKLENTEYVLTNKHVHIIQSWPKKIETTFPLLDIYDVELKGDKINDIYSTKDVWLGVWRLRHSNNGGKTYVPGWERLATIPDGHTFKLMLEHARIHAFEEIKRGQHLKI